ncbi:polyprotein, partial [Frijoles virus VP-161A]
TALSAMIVVFLLTSCIYVIIWVIWRVLRALHVIPAAAKSPIRWLCLLMKWLIRRCKDYLKKRRNQINQQIGWEDAEAQGQPRVRLMVPGAQVVRYSSYLLLLALIITPADSCSENIIASSSISKCRSESGKDVCVLSGTVYLKAGTIGSESCIIVKGTTDNQREFISIKTESSELLCREGADFWTSLYRPK